MKREKRRPKTLDTGGSVPSHPGFRKKKRTTTSLRAFLYQLRMTRKISQNLGCAVSREARSARAQTTNRSGGYLVHKALASVTARVGVFSAGRNLAAKLRANAAHTLRWSSRRNALSGNGFRRCRALCSLVQALTLTFAPDETESPKRCGRDCRSDSAAGGEIPRVPKRIYRKKRGTTT